jgi:phenylalanyl-tRNA synthetase beta chain
MNISYRWLLEIAPTIAGTPQDVADRLAMLGAPVDEVEDLGAGIGDVVIARVADVRPHPNADRLRLCTVEAGEGEPLQVVCGAPNVEAGHYYPFAPIGASLPGGISIRKAKLRGEVSEGMLCSARELGLGRDHEGLMTLAGEWRPGERFVEALSLDDARLLVDVTANRPDLLSHYGVARELAPGGVADLTLPPLPGGPAPESEIRFAEREGAAGGVRVRIDDADLCPRYMAAEIRGVRVAPSPEWLAARLRAIGVRPINNVVDATNYVLFELGQPLHAFDRDRLGGDAVVIRRARAGESIRTLDGVERKLDPEMLVIADAERPIAVAGVMGGEESEVTDATENLLIECALFEPRSVRRTRRALGLSTDASYRYERGVDPSGLPRALQRVVELILAVAGGAVAGSAVDVLPAPFEPRSIALRPERVAKLLGVEIAPEEIRALLEPIGFRIAEGEDATLRVVVPGWRPDVTREIDLIEEIARRRGYDSFPEALAAFRPSAVPEDPMFAVQRRVHEIFGRWCFFEARSASFAPTAPERVPLLDPLSSEESHLRDSLVPGLVRRVQHNWARGARDVRLYDIGTVFLPSQDGGVPREEVRVAAAFTGARRPPHGGGDAGAYDVWDLKGLLAEVTAELGLGEVAPGEAAVLVPLTVAGERLAVGDCAGQGGGGRITDPVADAPAWAEPLWVLELRLPDALPGEPVLYRALPEHPAVERDLALLVPDLVSAAAVAESVRSAAGELLEHAFPFDLYTGAGVPEGVHSLAWRLRFRAPGRTLTDAEVDAAIARVLGALEEAHGVRRR